MQRPGSQKKCEWRWKTERRRVTVYPGNCASLAAGCLDEVSLELGFKGGLEESRSWDRMEGT